MTNFVSIGTEFWKQNEIYLRETMDTQWPLKIDFGSWLGTK